MDTTPQEAAQVFALLQQGLSQRVVASQLHLSQSALVFEPGVGRRAGLTADGYITNILLEHVVPYAGFVDEDFILMHDNARCYTARVTQQFLREVDLRTMDWPALSSDINPVEHLWDELKQRVRARNPAHSSLEELKAALLEEWEGIPQDTVEK
ncbi:unnamed protein product [Pieris macdunnoughi]|uniref:Tc1-like transposase DDE domain-containing protein n=2 Tax=Pieris macdunnoughi TaxID=345717 RepID=A0A821T3K2_9NEOP|nr:unnamed protein product [Pieris macdunnoughi]